MRIYVIFTSALAGLVLYWAARQGTPVLSFQAVLLFLPALFLANVPVRIDDDTDVIFFNPIIITLIVTTGPLVGAVAAAMGMMVYEFWQKKSWEKLLFNASSQVLQAASVGLVFVLKSGSFPAPLNSALIATAMVMLIASWLTNIVLFSGLMTVMTRGNFIEHAASLVAWSAKHIVMEALVTILLLSLFQTLGYSGFLLMAGVLVAMRYGFQAYYQLRASYEEVQIMLISILDARDAYTAGHSQRVSQSAKKLAGELGLPAREAENIRRAALLHDIGKVNVPDAVLKKPSRLDPDELELMNQHPVNGARFVDGVSSLKHLTAIIRHHHERYDGEGYPDGLKGEEIPLGARVLLVADAYDAMTTDRPYRKALDKAEAIEQITQHAGTQFDPQVVWAAVRVFAEDLAGDPRFKSLLGRLQAQAAATRDRQGRRD